MNAPTAFSMGNHSLAAASGSPDDWRTWAAWGLLGRTERALSGLARFANPEARFHEAVASWIGGDDERAAAALAEMPAQHARALRDLIARPHIEVLAMLPGNRHGPHVHLLGAAADPRFRVSNISVHPDDMRVRPYASIDDYVAMAGPPDMFIVEMVEWHQIPPDFVTLPCKTIGVTSDFDLHMQGLHPWLRAFDELVVNDHTEFAGLRPTVDTPISVFPLVFGCPVDLPEPVRRTRDIDVFMSGTLFAPYHPDKAALLQRLLDEAGLNVLFVNGHLAEAAYFDLLSRAKITVSYYRRPGGMVTRGIEAACMGCVTLVQEGSVLAMYADEPHGLIPYDSSPDGLVAAVKATLADYGRHEAAAWNAWPGMRRRFAAEAVASRFLRFCAYLATHPRRSPSRPGRRPPAPLVQKRNMFWKGWMPGNGDPDFIAALRQGNVERLRESPDRSGRATVGNDIAREALLDHCARLIHSPRADGAEVLLVEALGELEETVRRHSDALVPRFNLIRAKIHFGRPEDVEEGLALARETVGMEPEVWRIEADDDVFPYDYASAHFDYRAYIDRLVAGMGPDGRTLASSAIPRLRALILASVRHYLAVSGDDADDAAAAVALNPTFEPFRLDHARRVLIGAGAEAVAEAVRTLTELASGSFLAVQAHHALRRAARSGIEVPEMERLDARMARMEASCRETEAYVHKMVGGYFDAQILGPGGTRGTRVLHTRDVPKGSRNLSVIAVDGGGSGGNAEALVRMLSGPSGAGKTREIVFVDLFDASGGPKEADTIVICGQDASLAHRHRGFNAGLRWATGRIVCLLDGLDAIGTGMLDRVEALFAPEDGAPPSLVVTWRTGDGRTGLLACRMLDVMMCGGLDQHEAYHGSCHDLGELAARLVQAGASPVDLGGGTAEFSDRRPPWADVWPGLVGAAPRRRPYREMPGLFRHGLELLSTLPEGRGLLARGLDLMFLLPRGGNSRRGSEGLEIAGAEQPGRILGGMSLPLPAGRFHLTVDVRSHGASEAPFASLSVAIGERPLADLSFTRANTQEPTSVMFEIGRDGQDVMIELRHSGESDWAIRDFTLSPFKKNGNYRGPTPVDP